MGSVCNLQSVGLLSADADLGNAWVPGHCQDALRVSALALNGLSRRKRHHIVPPVPLQDTHHTTL